jgi:hypothetical protein
VCAAIRKKKTCHSERREESLIFPTAMTRAATPPLSGASGETKTKKQAQKRRRDGGLKIRDSSLRSE